MTQWLINWLILSLSIFLVTQLLKKSVYVKNFGTALLVALVYGLLKLVLGKILFILFIPAIFLTLGLFYFLINAFLLWLTDKLIDDFEIKSFPMTIVASILISVIDTVSHWIIPGM